MRRLQIPQKLVYEKFYVHKKILRTRDCRRKLIKNLLPEKRKDYIDHNIIDYNTANDTLNNIASRHATSWGRPHKVP